MLDFIGIGFADLPGKDNKRKMLCLSRESNQRPLAFHQDDLDRLATGTDVMMRLKLLQNHDV